MGINLNKAIAGVALGILFASQLVTSAYAQGYNYYYANPYNRTYYNPYANPYNYQSSVFNSHPILSGTVVGGAVGALGGAAVGALDQDHGGSNVGTDAAVGAGTGAALGAGVGMIRNKALYGTYF